MKRREVLWMLLPCLLLLGAGWFLARPTKSPAPVAVVSTEPFRLQIKSIKKMPITPHDVEDGYDTKIRVLLGHKGKTPAQWGDYNFANFFSDSRVTIQRAGKWVRLLDVEKAFKGHGIRTGVHGFQKEQNAYQFDYQLRLRDIPASYGALTFETDLFTRSGGRGYSVVGADSFKFLRKSGVPSVRASLTARQAGETIQLPPVSRDPQITVRKVVVRPLTTKEKFEAPACDTKVHFHVFYSGPLSQKEFTGLNVNVDHSDSVYLQDATGKQYTFNTLQTTRSDETETKRRQIVGFYINLQQVPKRNGKVTLHAELRVGDNRPLKVQATVRPAPKDKGGKP
ncbi:MAG TPA: hypothetical protein VGB77_19055 [Abditibacteriaceae bacterium]|jgi:hypothetical protein